MEPENLFKAIGEGTRWRTLALLQRGELSVSELVEVLAQPQSTVSRHLKVLKGAGLIGDRRDGNTVLYSPVDAGSNGGGADLRGRILEWIDEQPLAAALGNRLATVIQRRRDMSRRFFDTVGDRWDALREESFGASFQLEAFLALLPSDWTVADIGTGTGYLLPALARQFDRVLAVEPVEKMLEAARNRVVYAGLGNVELCKGDMDAVPLTDASVDLATAVLVLHHVPVPRDSLAELHRIVRVGGRVLMVEQTAHQSDAFRDRMQDRWWGFEPDELCGWLKAVGFEDVRSHRLATVEQAADAPELFVATGCKGSVN